MAKALKVEFPESRNPQKLGLIGIGDFEDDATQYDAVKRFAQWADSSYMGTENRTHLTGTGPITLAFEEIR